MDTFQPAVAFNALEDDKREDERALQSGNEAMRLQSRHQIDNLRAQEPVDVGLLEAASQACRAPLDENRMSILAQIDAIKASTAPIENVPVEVLGYIFREVVALHVAPWLLTTVNKSWRRTAMRNPWLWSNIHVGRAKEDSRPIYRHSEWFVDGISRSCSGNTVACRSLEELAYFEEKSGVVPLDVRVCWDIRKDEWGVLQHLFGPCLSLRIRSLSIFLNVGPKAPTEWIIGPLPLLQELTYFSSREPLVGLIMAQAHQLKNLTAHRLPSNPLKYPFWTTLRTLDLRFGPDSHQLNQTITRLRLIEFIEGLPSHWPNAETPVVTLEHIKSIQLTCKLEHLARLRLPQLEKLVWFQFQFRSSSAVEDEDLEFSTHPDWGLSLPNLGEIQACAVGDAFAVALRGLPNVHTAVLVPKHFENSKDPWALDLIQSLAAPEDSLCPNLRSLTVRQLEADKTSAKPIISHLLSSRKALGRPFKHFQIVWACRTGMGETVQYV